MLGWLSMSFMHYFIDKRMGGISSLLFKPILEEVFKGLDIVLLVLFFQLDSFNQGPVLFPGYGHEVGRYDADYQE